MPKSAVCPVPEPGAALPGSLGLPALPRRRRCPVPASNAFDSPSGGTVPDAAFGNVAADGAWHTVTMTYTDVGTHAGKDLAIYISDVWANNNAKSSATIDDIKVSTSGGGGNPYAVWAAGPFSKALANPAANVDFDNGGMATGIEWALGGDPTDGGDDAGLAPVIDNSDPDKFVFIFDRSDAAAADANTSIVVEYGSALGGWTGASDGVNGVGIDASAVPAAGFHTVVVSIPKSLAAGGKLFARLKVVVTNR